MGITTIAWCDRTYNPWIGCQHVTQEECGDCYAARWAHRHKLNVWGGLYTSHRRITKTMRDPHAWEREAIETGKEIKVFCASLADVFEPHPDVVEARHRLWDTIEQTPHLTWQLLTKRPKFIKSLVPQSWLQTWPKHVWIGASSGTQQAAEKRIPYLLDLPMMPPVIFLSCEPLVSPVTLKKWLHYPHINWVIAGGYSGSQDWPMDPDWARSLRDECQEYGAAFFMKQMGTVYAKQHKLKQRKGEDINEFPINLRIQDFPVLARR